MKNQTKLQELQRFLAISLFWFLFLVDMGKEICESLISLFSTRPLKSFSSISSRAQRAEIQALKFVVWAEGVWVFMRNEYIAIKDESNGISREND